MSYFNIFRPLLKPLAGLALLCGLSAPVASAQILVTNWDITGNTVSFDISGTIAPGATIGANASQYLHIGVVGDNDWITAGGSVEVITKNSGVTIDEAQTIDFASGDYVLLRRDGLSTWTGGDTVDSHIMISGGTLIGANITLIDIIVTAGYGSTSPFPDVTNQVGAYSAVPEPASYAAILGGLGLIGAGCARRRHA